MSEVRREAFEAAFEAAPEGIWSAPGRVNLIGEHTDYNGGLSLPFAIDRRTRVAIRLRDDSRIRLATDFEPGIVEADLASLDIAPGWSAYVLGVLWAIGEHLDARGMPGLATRSGFDARFDSSVPVGVGLSSSAALEASICVAIDELWDLGLDRATMVDLCRTAENVVVGAPTGALDQSAALLTAPDAGVLLDFSDGTATQIQLGFDAAGLVVLVVDSLQRHDHATGEYGVRRQECLEGARLAGVDSLRAITAADLPGLASRMPASILRRVRHIVTDTARTAQAAELLRDGRPRDLGPLLTEAHASMRDDFENSIPEIDAAVEAAVAAGALGARITGGGFGGASIALVDAARADEIGSRIASAVEAQGFARPDVFPVRASDGAHRDGTHGDEGAGS